MGGVAMSRIMVTAGLVALGTAAPAAARSGGGEAAALEARAMELEGAGPSRWEDAASLYRKAAELREAGDAQAVQDLMRSGRLAWYRGKGHRAVSDLERAGDRALAFGDVLNAATAYLDAGWIANRVGDASRAYDLTLKGQQLSRSPLLGAVDRRNLQERVTGTRSS